MITLLKNNLFAQALLGLCGLLLLVALLLPVFTGEKLADQTSTNPDLESFQPSGELASAGELEDYAVVSERPLFSKTRRPVVEKETSDGDEEISTPNNINAKLAGVVITADQKIALIHDTQSNQYIRAQMNQGLDAPFEDWRVNKIDSRNVSMISPDGKVVELDLEVSGRQLAETKAPVKASNDEIAVAGESDADSQQEKLQSRADQIRARIAQRREELRQAAEEQAEQDGTGQNNDN